MGKQERAALLQRLDFKNVVEDASEISFYSKLAIKIVDFLSWVGSGTVNDIVRTLGGSSRRVLRLLDQMVQHQVLRYKEGKFCLEGDRCSTVRASQILPLFSVCQRNELVVDQELWNTLTTYMKTIVVNRPIPTFLFDQRPVTLTSSLCRGMYIYARGDFRPGQASVAILGDDDLSSIVLALLAREMGIKYKVVVFEIDRRLLDFIEEVSRAFQLNISLEYVDIYTQKTPSRYWENQFDTVMADPTPSPAPLSLFVNFGISLLWSIPEKVFYLSAYSPSYSSKIQIQQILTERGLLITDMLPGFVEYEVIEDSLSERDKYLYTEYKQKREVSFVETFMRLETTAETRPIEFAFDTSKLLGKATKRVLKDITKDPAYRKEPHHRSYLAKIAHISSSQEVNPNDSISSDKA